jgi:nucleotide-binding universal stress UspA family protein
VDFSDHSRRALLYAAALASRAHARLTVLYVNDPLLVAASAAAYHGEAIGAASQAELSSFVEDAVAASVRRATGLTTRTALGVPPREILRAASTGEHDLVVMGSKGLNGARRLFFGSTTSTVLRKSKVPVLAVPLVEQQRGATVPRGWPGKRIVAPVALGPEAEGDVRAAARVARWFDASLVLVHVVREPVLPGWFGGVAAAPLRRQSADARKKLEALRARVGRVPGATLVARGDPPEEIAAATEKTRAGLVVMTLRRGPGVLGHPIGSIAYRVLSRGIAPVLALPPLR